MRVTKSLARKLADADVKGCIAQRCGDDLVERWSAVRDLVDMKTGSKLDVVKLDMLTDWVVEYAEETTIR